MKGRTARRSPVRAADAANEYEGRRYFLPTLLRAGTQPALGDVRYPPNVRGLKSSWFVMLALLPVALMTYNP